MKTRTKIMIPVIVVLIIASFYLYIVANGYSPYYEGIGLTLYSDYKLQEYKLYSGNRDFSITKITDDDLKDTPELKNLIEKSLSKEYPLNKGGRVPATFEQLDNFQHQYAEILSKKYSRNATSFFTSDDRHVPEKYLAIDSTVHLRSFEGNHFEYDGVQYGIQPNSFYVPFMEDDDLLRLEVYKTNGPLREGDHMWEDLSDKQISLKPLIADAINDIGQHQENIEVMTSGLSPATMTKYEKWYDDTLQGSLFEYKGKIFSIGFWIA